MRRALLLLLPLALAACGSTERLARLGRAPDLAGPQVHELEDLARRVLRVRGRRRPVVGVRLFGAAGQGLAEGGLLPTGAARRGQVTFADWLATG